MLGSVDLDERDSGGVTRSEREEMRFLVERAVALTASAVECAPGAGGWPEEGGGEFRCGGQA